jgi:hypothetical protein
MLEINHLDWRYVMAHRIVVGVAALLLFGSAVSLGVGMAAPRPAAPLPTGRCPTGALGLPADGVIGAARQALAEAARDYPGLRTAGAEVMAADRAGFAGARGGEVARQCGSGVRDRTVIVQLLFPRMLPSASLSEAVVAVSRFVRGYRVWEILH